MRVFDPYLCTVWGKKEESRGIPWYDARLLLVLLGNCFVGTFFLVAKLFLIFFWWELSCRELAL